MAHTFLPQKKQMSPSLLVLYRKAYLGLPTLSILFLLQFLLEEDIESGSSSPVLDCVQ